MRSKEYIWKRKNLNQGLTASAGPRAAGEEGGGWGRAPQTALPLTPAFEIEINPTLSPSNHVKPGQKDILPSVSTLTSKNLQQSLLLQDLQVFQLQRLQSWPRSAD